MESIAQLFAAAQSHFSTVSRENDKSTADNHAAQKHFRHIQLIC